METRTGTPAQATFNQVEAGAQLGVHRNTLRRWLESGKIKGTKRGKDWEIPASEIERIRETAAASFERYAESVNRVEAARAFVRDAYFDALAAHILACQKVVDAFGDYSGSSPAAARVVIAERLNQVGMEIERTFETGDAVKAAMAMMAPLREYEAEARELAKEHDAAFTREREATNREVEALIAEVRRRGGTWPPSDSEGDPE